MENLLYLKSRQLKLKNITPWILQAPKDQPFGLEWQKVLEIELEECSTRWKDMSWALCAGETPSKQGYNVLEMGSPFPIKPCLLGLMGSIYYKRWAFSWTLGDSCPNPFGMDTKMQVSNYRTLH